jgi:hypothetical protein
LLPELKAGLARLPDDRPEGVRRRGQIEEAVPARLVGRCRLGQRRRLGLRPQGGQAPLELEAPVELLGERCRDLRAEAAAPDRVVHDNHLARALDRLDQQFLVQRRERAGIDHLGVDPGPLTLRELLWMAEGRGRSEWAHTASILALLANAHRDPKRTKAFAPADFNPYEARDGRKPITKTKDLSILKAVFVKPKGA